MTARSKILQAINEKTLSLEGVIDRHTTLDELKYCSDLTELDLSGNNLSVVPPELKRLTGLQRLYLRNNQLESLNGIEPLTGLRDLQLQNNHIQFLPPGVGFFTSLQTLRLDSNPVSTIPKHVMPNKSMLNPDEIHHLLAYLRGISSGGEQAHNAVKIMVVGDENVGKTRYRRCCTVSTVARPRSLGAVYYRVFEFYQRIHVIRGQGREPFLSYHAPRAS